MVILLLFSVLLSPVFISSYGEYGKVHQSVYRYVINSLDKLLHQDWREISSVSGLNFSLSTHN